MSQHFTTSAKPRKQDLIYNGKALCIDIAKSTRCECPGCTHPITTGTAYKVQLNGSKGMDGKPVVIDVGPTCVKKYDPAFDPKKLDSKYRGNPFEGISEPLVPDLSRGVGSLSAFEPRPNTRMTPARGRIAAMSVEQGERLLDEAYLTILGQRLPGISKLHFPLPEKWIVDAAQEYERDPAAVDLSRVRDLRQFHERCERKRGLDALQLCYAQAYYLDRFMTPDTREYAKTSRSEQAILPRYMSELRQDHQLSTRATGHLNGMLMRAYPRAKPFEVPVSDTRQATLLEMPMPPREPETRIVFCHDPNITIRVPIDRPKQPAKDNGTGLLFGTG